MTLELQGKYKAEIKAKTEALKQAAFHKKVKETLAGAPKTTHAYSKPKKASTLPVKVDADASFIVNELPCRLALN